MSLVSDDAGEAALGDWELQAGLDAESASFPAEGQCRGDTIWIFRTKWGFRGVQQHCPHAQVALGTAKLLGDEKMIRCALHGMTFRLDDGSGANCRLAVKVYEIRHLDGMLYARPKATTNSIAG
jgi:nitrite reductase/ring-hydroxylating ferredoxin subunit